MEDLPHHTIGTDELTRLKQEFGVDSFYSINYGSSSVGILQTFKNMFAPNSKVIQANDATLTDTFKNILYQVNASTPQDVETIDGLLDISDMEVSTEKPMKVTVTKNGSHVKTITITEYPTSSEGVIIISGGKMYLSVDGLAKECGLTDMDGVSVSIEYFSKT